MTCTCPDYKTRKEACKHIFGAMLFVKNRGKQTIEGPDGNGNGHVKTELKEVSDKPQEDPSKSFDRQSTITRLAVLNTATEILKTHRKAVELTNVVPIAAHCHSHSMPLFIKLLQ